MGELASNCLILISTVTSHVDWLTKLLAELSAGDHASVVSSRSSLAKSLTVLAELHDLESHITPELIATGYRRRYIAALMRAVDVVHGLCHEDFTVVGAFLGV
jgi:hypothetical protein